jgi:hypothetical protein
LKSLISVPSQFLFLRRPLSSVSLSSISPLPSTS